jgi:hypothetical protein
VPSGEADIRLVDVVVSKPHRVHGGVVQYDSGRATPSGFERTGSLNTPPTVLLNAVANLRAKHMRGRGRLAEYLSKLDSLPDFTREAAGLDARFSAAYDHRKGAATCEECVRLKLRSRSRAAEARVCSALRHDCIRQSGDEERGGTRPGQRRARRLALLRDGSGGSDEQLPVSGHPRHLRLRRLAQEQAVA